MALTFTHPLQSSISLRSPSDLTRRHVLPGDAQTTLVASTLVTLPGTPSVLSTAEWDVLFNAVRTRLRLAVAEGLAETAGQPDLRAVGRVLSNVLECVDALDQLQVMLAEERGRRPR